MPKIRLEPIKAGWAAFGPDDSWGVHGKTKEEAIAAYHDSEAFYARLDARNAQRKAGVAENQSAVTGLPVQTPN
jgi:hypothetical protein